MLHRVDKKCDPRSWEIDTMSSAEYNSCKFEAYKSIQGSPPKLSKEVFEQRIPGILRQAFSDLKA